MIGRFGCAAFVVAAAICAGGSIAGEFDALLAGGGQRDFVIAIDSETATRRLQEKVHECFDPTNGLQKHLVGIQAKFERVTRTGTVVMWSYHQVGKSIDFRTQLLPAARGTTLVKSASQSITLIGGLEMSNAG